MEVKDYITGELEHANRMMKRVLDGLNHNELSWRPGPGCNSIGIIFFHLIRSEDNLIQTRISGRTQVWESEKWYQKLNLPVSESGARYTAEQVACFPVPELKDLQAYADAVRAQTVEYLKGLTPENFDKIINIQPFGELTLGSLLALMVGHQFQHIGEISYLRGLQRGMNK